MLDIFLITNREAIIARAQVRVASRTCPKSTAEELANGIPVFLDQLGEALRLAEASDVIDHEQIANSAGRHGRDLLRMGLTIAQVVHDYGDVCQVITELAVQQEAPISGEEFRTLNLCLDDAIAGAVTEYARQRESSIADQGTERLGVLAHELRNLVNTAMLSFETIKSGRVAAGGSTGGVLSRSLMGLRDLIDRSLADVRLDAGASRTRVEIAPRFRCGSQNHFMRHRRIEISAPSDLRHVPRQRLPDRARNRRPRSLGDRRTSAAASRRATRRTFFVRSNGEAPTAAV